MSRLRWEDGTRREIVRAHPIDLDARYDPVRAPSTIAPGLALVAIAVLAVGPACFVPRHLEPPEVSARSDAAAIAAAAARTLASGPSWSRCPTIESIVESRFLGDKRRILDPWERAFVIECDGDDVRAISLGPDGKLGSPDDVHP